MSKVLVIGCGGVASVAIHKCCQVSEVFTELCIASRTKSKCDKLVLPNRPRKPLLKLPLPRWTQMMCSKS